MSYKSLYSIYYKTPDEWERIYQSRFNSPFTHHISLSIHQYNRHRNNPGFYCYTEEMAVLQESIMKHFNSCMEIIKRLPGVAIPQFLYTCLIEEIKSSNDIEGVHSTRKEIIDALDTPENERQFRRLGGIVNKYDRIINGETIPLQESQDIRDLYNDFIYDEIKRDDPRNLPDGKIFRKDSVDIISGTQKVLHRGIYPESEIIRCMDIALSILNDKGIPSLVRVSIFHYLFGYIHPFYDGNGRMSRFITSYFLAKILHPTIALQLSVLIKKHKKKYYDLFAITDSDINRGDLTPFIIGTLKFTDKAISFTRDNLISKYQKYRDYEKKLDSLDLKNKNVWTVADILLQAAIFSNIGASKQEVRRTIDKSENSVSKYIRQIPCGLVLINKTIRPYRYKLDLSKI